MACGGASSDVDTPPAAVRTELTGTVTPGYVEDTSQPGSPTQAGRIVVSVRGSQGIMRTSDSFGAGPADQHRTGLTELSPPYMLSNALVDGSFLVSVATGAGHANVTPLTTLLTAQLLGTDPQTAFIGYGSEATEQIARITDPLVVQAQAEVTAYLQRNLGVTVRSGTASFVTSAFAAQTGDPMFDTIVALHARLLEEGRTLTELAQTLAAEARLCLTEKLQVTIAGQNSAFCPQTKGGEPDPADPTVLKYTFVDTSAARLTVRVQGDAVLDLSFATSTGVVYPCTGAGCQGVQLAAPNADLTRAISFTDTRLGGASLAGASLTGTLTLPTPGVAIPVLPCDNNKFALVLPDRSVVAQCADADDPLGLGGIMGGGAGLPRIGFTLGGTLQVYVQAGMVTSITYLLPHTDELSGLPVYFQCKGAECSGAEFGPPTINSDLGVDLTVRDFSMEGVELRALRVDGTALDNIRPAVLQGVFTTIEYIDPTDAFPPDNDCAGTTDRLVAQPDYRPEATAICPLPGDKRTHLASDGTLSLSLIGSVPYGVSPILNLTVVAGAASRIELTIAAGVFSCAPCTGVTVSAPDSLGQRQVSFDATPLRETGPAGLPGEHGLTLTGSFAAPAP